MGGIIMGFKGNRGPLVIFAVIFIVIIVVAASASSSPKKPNSAIAGLAECTVNAEVGLAQVKITNQNLRTSIIKTASDLPFSFNFTEGDTLAFTITVLSGYTWNAWELNQSPWFAQGINNTLTIKSTEDITLNAKFLMTQP
jgi:hypothetical protein